MCGYSRVSDWEKKKKIKSSWRWKWQPTPISLPGEFHGQRILAGCSPWGHKECDITEWLSHVHSDNAKAYPNMSESISHSLSHVQLFAAPWTVPCQAPLSMEFSRQGYWSGLPCPPPGDLPNPGIRTRVSHIAGGSFTVWTTREPQKHWSG